MFHFYPFLRNREAPKACSKRGLARAPELNLFVGARAVGKKHSAIRLIKASWSATCFCLEYFGICTEVQYLKYITEAVLSEVFTKHCKAIGPQKRQQTMRSTHA